MKVSAGIVAIHQPNFFPWLGYFDKIFRCDRFVFLDNVQLPRTGAGSWVNRVNLFIGPTVGWFTMPISKPAGSSCAISEAHLMADDRVFKKLARTLESTYRKAPHYNETSALILPLLLDPAPNLAAYNMRAIIAVSGAMGILPSRFVSASELPSDGEKSTDRLVRIVREVGGKTYLYGGGAKAIGGYQEDEKFHAVGLQTAPQNFQHPVYRQFNSNHFYPGLSVVDALMNLGVKGVVDLLSTPLPFNPGQPNSRGPDASRTF